MGVQELRQQTAKQILDAIQTKESQAIAREGHQITREGHEITRQNVLDRLEQAQKNQEATQAYRDKIADLREKVAENTIGHTEALEAMAQANYELRKQSLKTPKPMTEFQEFSQEQRREKMAEAIESGTEGPYILTPEKIAAKVAAWNRLYPEDPYVEEIVEPATKIPEWVPGLGGKEIGSSEKRWVRQSEKGGPPEVKSIDFSNVQFPTNPKTGKLVTKEDVLVESQRTGKTVTEILNLIGAKVK